MIKIATLWRVCRAQILTDSGDSHVIRIVQSSSTTTSNFCEKIWWFQKVHLFLPSFLASPAGITKNKLSWLCPMNSILHTEQGYKLPQVLIPCISREKVCCIIFGHHCRIEVFDRFICEALIAMIMHLDMGVPNYECRAFFFLNKLSTSFSSVSGKFSIMRNTTNLCLLSF
jgi:hypothetical protein